MSEPFGKVQCSACDADTFRVNHQRPTWVNTRGYEYALVCTRCGLCIALMEKLPDPILQISDKRQKGVRP